MKNTDKLMTPAQRRRGCRFVKWCWLKNRAGEFAVRARGLNNEILFRSTEPYTRRSRAFGNAALFNAPIGALAKLLPGVELIVIQTPSR